MGRPTGDHPHRYQWLLWQMPSHVALATNQHWISISAVSMATRVPDAVIVMATKHHTRFAECKKMLLLKTQEMIMSHWDGTPFNVQ